MNFDAINEALKAGAPDLSALARWHLTVISLLVTGGRENYRLQGFGREMDVAGAWGVYEGLHGEVPPALVDQAAQAVYVWRRHVVSGRMSTQFPSIADRMAWFAYLWWRPQAAKYMSPSARHFGDAFPSSTLFAKAQELVDRDPDSVHLPGAEKGPVSCFLGSIFGQPGDGGGGGLRWILLLAGGGFLLWWILKGRK